MYQVLQVAQVVPDGGRIAKKFSGWKDKILQACFFEDKMYTMVIVPPGSGSSLLIRCSPSSTSLPDTPPPRGTSE